MVGVLEGVASQTRPFHVRGHVVDEERSLGLIREADAQRPIRRRETKSLCDRKERCGLKSGELQKSTGTLQGSTKFGRALNIGRECERDVLKLPSRSHMEVVLSRAHDGEECGSRLHRSRDVQEVSSVSEHEFRGWGPREYIVSQGLGLRVTHREEMLGRLGSVLCTRECERPTREEVAGVRFCDGKDAVSRVDKDECGPTTPPLCRKREQIGRGVRHFVIVMVQMRVGGEINGRASVEGGSSRRLTLDLQPQTGCSCREGDEAWHHT